MRLADETTVATLRAMSLHKGLNELARSVSAGDWGPTAGAMSDVLNNKTITIERENTLRALIGLEPLPRVVEKQVCPIHDTVHDCTCDGTQGTAVWIHPKEKLVKAPGFGAPRPPRKTIQLPPEAYAIMVEWRERIGGDWFETIRAMDYLARGVTR